MDLGDRCLNAACDDRIYSHTRSRKTHQVVIPPTFRMERSPNDNVKGYFIKVTSPILFFLQSAYYCNYLRIWPNHYKNL
jgi:hypothetical protein